CPPRRSRRGVVWPAKASAAPGATGCAAPGAARRPARSRAAATTDARALPRPASFHGPAFHARRGSVSQGSTGGATPHPLVTQLRFTRSEWVRGLKAVTADEAARRYGSINPIAWMIGHLAWQEQLYWLERAQGLTPVPEVKQFGYGKPLAAPSLDEAWAW